jgi:hypothetical protein
MSFVEPIYDLGNLQGQIAKLDTGFHNPNNLSHFVCSRSDGEN